MDMEIGCIMLDIVYCFHDYLKTFCPGFYTKLSVPRDIFQN